MSAQRSSTRSSWCEENRIVAPPAAALAQHLAHLGNHRVQARERLVEDQHFGPVDHRGGQLDALLVAVESSRPGNRRARSGRVAPARPSPRPGLARAIRDSRPKWTSWAATPIRGYRPRSSGM